MNVVFENGDVYEGDFVNNIKEGYGIMSYNNGEKYQGEFKNNVKDGYGIMIYNNGEKCSRFWWFARYRW